MDTVLHALDHRDLHNLECTNLSASDTEAHSLADGILSNPALESLRFFQCAISHSGWRYVLWSVQKHSRITVLSIVGTDIGYQAVAILADELKKKSSLTWLRIQPYEPWLENMLLLISSLRFNKTLTYLDIGPIPKKAQGALVNVLKKNKTLRTIRVLVEGATLSNKIRAALTRNRSEHAKALAIVSSAEHKVPWSRSKLMIIGQGRVGKTALFRSLRNLPFDSRLQSTVGVNVVETNASQQRGWKERNRGEYSTNFLYLSAFETVQASGGASPKQKAKGKAKSPNVSKASFSIRTKLSNTVRQMRENSIQFTDFDHDLDDGEGDKLSQAVLERDTIQLSIWDFGGQSVFHTLHHVFITDYGFYLLVFALPGMMDNPVETTEFLRFWINSVKFHVSKVHDDNELRSSASIALVGTFFEQVRHEQSALTKVSEELKVLMHGSKLKLVRNGQLMFYPIDNSTGHGVSSLRKSIQSQVAAEAYVHREVNLRWVKFLDTLLDGTIDTGADRTASFDEDIPSRKGWFSLSEVVGMAGAVGITNSEEVESALELFHELGLVLHFTQTESLRETVITSPQWLVDKMSKVIRDGEVHSFQDVAQEQLEEDLEEFETRALISRDLLEHFWDRDHVQFMIDLMRSLMLLSTWKFQPKEEIYLVPSMVHSKKIEKPELLETGQYCTFTIQFQYLPNGVFERLVCLAVEYSSTKGETSAPEIAMNHCIVYVPHCVIFERHEDRVQVYFSESSAAAKGIVMVLAMMKKLKEDVMGEDFTWGVEVHVDNERIPYNEAQKQKLLPWFGEIQSEEVELDVSLLLDVF